jgi:hypothetical protein
LPNPVQFSTFYSAKKGIFFLNDTIITFLGIKLRKSVGFFMTEGIKIKVYVKNAFFARGDLYKSQVGLRAAYKSKFNRTNHPGI